MWAGNSLKNDLTQLSDLADFLLNSDTLKISYKNYLDKFDFYLKKGFGVNKALRKTYSGTLWYIVYMVFLFKVFDIMIIYMMYALNKYLQDKQKLGEGVNFFTLSIIFGIICISDLLKTIFSAKSEFVNNELGLNIKGLTMNKVFIKVQKISLKSNKEVSEGEIIDYI
jgi:ABC-type multidrug transport system fused ATPase/permease subunit